MPAQRLCISFLAALTLGSCGHAVDLSGGADASLDPDEDVGPEDPQDIETVSPDVLDVDVVDITDASDPMTEDIIEECEDHPDPCHGGPFGEPTPVASCPVVAAEPPAATELGTRLLWTGSEYVILYKHTTISSDLHFTRLDTTGRPVADVVRTTGIPMLFGADWTGSAIGVNWIGPSEEGHDLYYQAFDGEGERLHPPVPVTTHGKAGEYSFGRGPGLLWTGSFFAATWTETREGEENLFYIPLDETGTPLSSFIRQLTEHSRSLRFSLAFHDHSVWTGAELGVVYHVVEDDHTADGTSFVHVPFSGIPVDYWYHNMLDNAVASIAWSGSEYLLVVRRDSTSQIFLKHVSSAGRRLDENVVVTSSVTADPDIAWSGETLAIAWPRSSDTTDNLHFKMLHPDSTDASTELIIPTIGDPRRLDLIWTGEDYAVTWTEAGGTSLRLMFSRIVICE